MDVVTITDHDSIDGCLEFLDRHPGSDDFFVSEEVSCRFPAGDLEVHLGVYGLTERFHRYLRPIRGNVFEVTAALREAGVFFSLNHLLHFYRGQVPLADYLRLIDEVPALETRNGTMLPVHNELVARIASRWRATAGLARTGQPCAGRIAVGGSDAHTLRRIGRTWTSAPGRTAAEFLDSLARGRTQVGGLHGSARTVAVDAYSVIGAYVASLLGHGPRDHAPVHRAACLIFSAASIPAQILPAVITKLGKLAERREVERASEELAAWLDPSTPASDAVKARV